jgi:hypothetical protein
MIERPMMLLVVDDNPGDSVFAVYHAIVALAQLLSANTIRA